MQPGGLLGFLCSFPYIIDTSNDAIIEEEETSAKNLSKRFLLNSLFV